MRGKKRARLKAISRDGWTILQEGTEPDGRYVLEVHSPTGETLSVRSRTRPRCYFQAHALIRQAKQVAPGPTQP